MWQTYVLGGIDPSLEVSSGSKLFSPRLEQNLGIEHGRDQPERIGLSRSSGMAASHLRTCLPAVD
jgi:hypothetical protein